MKRTRLYLLIAALVLGVSALGPPVVEAQCYGCKHTVSRAYVIATCVPAASNETGYSICEAKVISGTSSMECHFAGNFCTEMTVGGGGAGGGAGSGGGGSCIGGPAGCPAECFACGGNGGGGPAF